MISPWGMQSVTTTHNRGENDEIEPISVFADSETVQISIPGLNTSEDDHKREAPQSKCS